MENFSFRNDFLSFFKKPGYYKSLDISEKAKVIIVFKVFMLTLLGLFIINIPLEGLKKLGLITEIAMKTNISLKTIPAYYKSYFLISTILFVPMFEEIAFRLCLIKFKVNYFIISVSVLLGMWIINFFWDYFWIPKSYLILSVIKIVYILLFAVLTGGFLLIFRKKIEVIEKGWNKNAAFLIYFMSVLFAVGHINNLKFQSNDWFFMPLILAPFFVYGLSFTYIRIRLGIIYSITLHFIILLISYGLPEIVNILKAIGRS